MKNSRWRMLSRVICAAAFVLAGTLHFLYPNAYCKIMPDILVPWALPLVYISGAIEIIGGLGLFFAKVRLLSVWVLLLLLVAVFPANINMAYHPDRFANLPVWLLYARLPLQGIVMLWVWSCRD